MAKNASRCFSQAREKWREKWIEKNTALAWGPSQKKSRGVFRGVFRWWGLVAGITFFAPRFFAQFFAQFFAPFFAGPSLPYTFFAPFVAGWCASWFVGFWDVRPCDPGGRYLCRRILPRPTLSRRATDRAGHWPSRGLRNGWRLKSGRRGIVGAHSLVGPEFLGEKYRDVQGMETQSRQWRVARQGRGEAKWGDRETVDEQGGGEDTESGQLLEDV